MLMQGHSMRHPLPGRSNGQIKRRVTRTEHIKLRHRVKQTHEAQVNQLVFGSVHAFGGSISAEHGVGSLKLIHLEQHKSPVALAMMRTIKQALDPQGLMNPNRVLRI
ncbi:MAG: hypothetical protein EB007_01750 [Betaproteobacteria bacterium]|nr:hypothetical protein [Betaproteobacteria bacterium]